MENLLNDSTTQMMSFEISLAECLNFLEDNENETLQPYRVDRRGQAPWRGSPDLGVWKDNRRKSICDLLRYDPT